MCCSTWFSFFLENEKESKDMERKSGLKEQGDHSDTHCIKEFYRA